VKIVVITSYQDPDYIRARTLRAGLKKIRGVETLVIKNSKKGFGRYGEMIKAIISIKRQEKPDAFLLTFRGYETLPFLLLIAGKTPVIFDEFINATEWIVDEHHILKAGSWPAKLLNWWYGRQLKKCRVILADTPAHAAYSARRSNVPLEKYVAIPVGTDETVFQLTPKNSVAPSHTASNSRIHYNVYGQGADKLFKVFYYGSMVPLHGLDIVLKAAEILKTEKNISFLLVGGGERAAASVEAAKKAGANATYKKWIPFEELPAAINQSSLCLAGPFGNTLQAQLVVTGKAYQFLACAAPTVIGQNRASKDFINEQNALVVKQGSAEALAESIRWAAEHPSELIKIGQAGRQLFGQKFSTSVISARLHAVLQKL
jgi:glycosyltransferase involved in cell wall biosynthesis